MPEEFGKGFILVKPVL